MSSAEAYRRCPTATFVRPEMAKYKRHSEGLWALVRSAVPVVEQVGIDEGYLDLSEVAETAGEKSALAARFGRRIRFGRQDRDAYLAICHRLVRDRLGEVPAELDADAMRFAVQGHGLSARTAVQFAETYRR
jgi:predicted AAA+ superfamily ATPase